MDQLTAIDRTLTAPAVPEGLDTPRVIVDLDHVDANVARMQALLDGRGVALRPHAKTHKSPFFAHRQLDAGAVGITVAVLGEAEVMADADVADVFVAYPVWAVGAKAERMLDLAGRIRLAVGADSVAGVEQLGRTVAGASARPDVLIEIDSGEGRTGTDAVGVVGAAVRALEDAGFDLPVVSAGSTPTAVVSSAAPITEERPGTYVFGDRQQANLGGSEAGSLALAVAATVVSTSIAGGCVLDAGAKALAKDKPGWLAGHGVVPQLPGAVIRAVYDHHAVVELPSDLPRPRVGDVVAVVPNHACPVVNLTDELVLTRSGEAVEHLPVLARGRTS